MKIIFCHMNFVISVEILCKVSVQTLNRWLRMMLQGQCRFWEKISLTICFAYLETIRHVWSVNMILGSEIFKHSSQQQSASFYLKNYCKHVWNGFLELWAILMNGVAPRIHSKELRWTGVPLNQEVGPQRYWTSVYPIENPQAHKLNIEEASESTRLRKNS